MLTLWALIVLNPVPGVNVPPRDVAYYHSVQQCEHAAAASVRRWPELKMDCLRITR
jgi:hypothetical protein